MPFLIKYIDYVFCDAVVFGEDNNGIINGLKIKEVIKIGKPRIVNSEGNCYLYSHIQDEAQHIDDDLFYSVPEEYGVFLTHEVSDAFIVGCLLPAVFYNQDIVVDGPISERLFYNLNNSVSYVLSLVYGNRIRIHAKELVHAQFGSSGVGCGCSLGVDSFAAMIQHIPYLGGAEMMCAPKSYQITHLTYFNVGAMGYVDLKKAKDSYDKDIKMVRAFSNEVHLPLVSLESNFSILYKDFDFDASGDFRNFSAALSLQKLFGKYLYGSSFPICDFKFDKGQTGYYESLIAPLISTESMEIVIANPDMSRIDKTKFIIDNPLVHKYLYVCWKELIANRWPDSTIAKVKDYHLNCSRCDKCKRTLLAIDLLGKLDEFEAIFDIPYWKSVKESYIAKVLSNRQGNAFYKDLCFLMEEVGYTPSIKEVDGKKKKSVLFRIGSKIKRKVLKH